MRSAKIERFEDLLAWQKARDLALRVYALTEMGMFSKDFGLKDQIRRAAVSVMSNIAEGFERYSRPEFQQFLSVARGSVAEVRSQVCLARDLGYTDRQDLDQVYGLCRDTGNLIGALRKSLERPRAP